MQNDILNELGTNFIEYAVAVNTDRAIPNSTDGLKPVAKRIIYGAYDQGFKSDKPHVKCANIVGNVMADWHPHGDSSIYGALVRLSQQWVMRYPLINFHGSNGNIDGDGPAAYRYTEARLSKIAEDGLLNNINKNKVDFIDNYSETKKEPIELPAIFPNLLCNPNSGIGVSMASSWACHNLNEVAQAIYDYIDGKEPMLPGPDFPTGGIVINKNDIPNIMKTGHGSVKIRGKYIIEKNNIVFTEIPYGTNTEALMNQIGDISDKGEILGINDIRNEGNKKGFRLVIECDKNVDKEKIVNKLFDKTNLQTSFSYNQVALVNKVPTELNLKDCIKIYIDYNSKCIIRECEFDINKAKHKLHIILGMLKALDIIDKIIAMIKASNSSTDAKATLISWDFSEEQAKAILDMKLAKLSKLEKEELINQQKELEDLINKLTIIIQNPILELRKRLQEIVKKYGDERRTQLLNIEIKKEIEEKETIIPENCIISITKDNMIKRVAETTYQTQKRNTKGKTKGNELIQFAGSASTIDYLYVFTTKGKMYKLLVNNIPADKGVGISNLIKFDDNDKPISYLTLTENNDCNYILFVTKNGLVKKTPLSEYTTMKKNSGIVAIRLKEGDSIAKILFINKEDDVILFTKNAMCIRMANKDIEISSRITIGQKGIKLAEGDEVIGITNISKDTSNVLIVSQDGYGKRVEVNEFTKQGRGGTGSKCNKSPIITAFAVDDNDKILINGNNSSIKIAVVEIPVAGKTALGAVLIKNNIINSVSKI